MKGKIEFFCPLGGVCSRVVGDKPMCGENSGDVPVVRFGITPKKGVCPVFVESDRQAVELFGGGSITRKSFNKGRGVRSSTGLAINSGVITSRVRII
jgi:hypothetical protein